MLWKMTSPRLKLRPILLHINTLGPPHGSLSILHATETAFTAPLFLRSAMELQYISIIFVHSYWRQFWLWVVQCRRSWRWWTVRMGFLVRPRHLMVLVISQRRIVWSLIGLWWFPIVCVALVIRLFICCRRMYVLWRAVVYLGQPVSCNRLALNSGNENLWIFCVLNKQRLVRFVRFFHVFKCDPGPNIFAKVKVRSQP